MPEHPSGQDPELLRALARLELGDLPGPLHDAVATALAWAHHVDAAAANAAADATRRPR